MEIHADDGYYFGLGVFETIGVERGHPLFLEEHLQRLAGGAEILGIPADLERAEWLVRGEAEKLGRGAVKLTVSEKNLLVGIRKNPYGETIRRQGIEACFAKAGRSSASPLSYIKSLCCGDSILEKRAAGKRGFQEALFQNERGELAEGAVSNLFLVKQNGAVVTPALGCGLLPGIVRGKLLESGIASEAVLFPEDLWEAKEAFLTNSLMGVISLGRVEGQRLEAGAVTKTAAEVYERLAEEDSKKPRF